jgi:acyl dehydratase
VVAVGEVFTKRHVFTAEDMSDFARRAGDMNPLHHDEAFARGTRYGGLIASGTQSSALLMGMLATRLAQDHETAGLDFTFRFRRGIPAGMEAILSWRAVSLAPDARLRGEVIALAGDIADDAGQIYVTSEARAVLWPRAAALSQPRV